MRHQAFLSPLLPHRVYGIGDSQDYYHRIMLIFVVHDGSRRREFISYRRSSFVIGVGVRCRYPTWCDGVSSLVTFSAMVSSFPCCWDLTLAIWSWHYRHGRDLSVRISHGAYGSSCRRWHHDHGMRTSAVLTITGERFFYNLALRVTVIGFLQSIFHERKSLPARLPLPAFHRCR